MKSKSSEYLLDECITIHWRNSTRLLDGKYRSSISVVGRGAKDEQVLNYAIKTNRTIVTADMRLTLWAIFENQDVIFCRRDGQRFLINAKSKKLEMSNPHDLYLLERETFTVP